MGLLDGKVVIVTGGGNGLGRAYCLAIAAEGGMPVIADIDGAAAEGVAGEVRDRGGQALAVQADVTSAESCRRMAAAASDRWARIDGLVNNAAIANTVPMSMGGFEEILEEDWDRLMAVNLKG